MKKIRLLLVAFCVLAMVSCNQEGNTGAATADGSKQESIISNKTAARKASPSANVPKGKVNWITLDELQAKQKQEPRKVVVDLYTNWCGWCKRMDKATFQHQNIAEYINENFYAVKFNAETPTAVNFKGENFKYVKKGRRGTNELAYKFILGDKPTGRVGYPTIAFLDEKLDRIDAYAGYKDASKFDGVMRFINEDHYKSKTLAQYQSSFKSDIQATPLAPRKPRINSKLKPNQPIKLRGNKAES